MLTYFTQVSAIWLVGLLFYIGGLRQDKMLLGNRVYLLTSFCAGLLLPWLDWSFFQAIALPIAVVGEIEYWLDPVIINAQSSDTTLLATINWPVLLYSVGCGLFALRLMTGLWRIYQLIVHSPVRYQGNIRYVTVAHLTTPFSWGSYLFWNDAMQTAASERAAILAHERAHIRQRHTLDILLIELVGMFFWWNPLWYFYRHAIREVHEFLADAAATRHLSTGHYGRLLIRQVLAGGTPALSHTFHTTTIKNRITMLTKNYAHPRAGWKYLLFLPLLVLVLVACESVQKDVSMLTTKDYAYQEQVDTIIVFDPEDYTETMNIVSYRVYEEAEVLPVFGDCPGLSGKELKQCSNSNLIAYMVEELKYPATAERLGLEHKVVSRFTVTTKGSVQHIRILNAQEDLTSEQGRAIQEMEQEVTRLLKAMPAWQPGQIDGKVVAVDMTIPVSFKL